MIEDCICKVHADLTKHGFIVLYIGTYGSYNYELQGECSDLDLKAIVYKPIFKLVNDRKFVNQHFITHYVYKSYTPKTECVVHTFDEFICGLTSYDDTFLEILFSKYKFVHALFQDDYTKILEHMRHNLKINKGNLYSNIYNKSLAIVNKFVNWSFDPLGKKTYHLLRYVDFMCSYDENNDFEKSIVTHPNSREAILNHKYNFINSERMKKESVEFLANIEVMAHHARVFKDEESTKELQTLLYDSYHNFIQNVISNNEIMKTLREYAHKLHCKDIDIDIMHAMNVVNNFDEYDDKRNGERNSEHVVLEPCSDECVTIERKRDVDSCSSCMLTYKFTVLLMICMLSVVIYERCM